MKVDSLRLKQLGVFEDVELAFSPGINVFLGTNGTGKSHAFDEERLRCATSSDAA